jgi:hypothetical protein
VAARSRHPNGEGDDAPTPGNCAHGAILRTAIVQKADSSPLFDDRHAALQSGTSEKHMAMLRRITRLFPGAANRLSEETAALSPLSSASLEIIRRLAAKLPSEPAPKRAMGSSRSIFLGLSKSNAQRLPGLWQVREPGAGSA